MGDSITALPPVTPSPTPDMNRNRLPTLFEVLSRRTTAPVDLFSFYIYMRDQQRSVDYLDFWLDVSQHMSLCRHYVRELRRSVLVDTPENEKASKHSSAVLSTGSGNMQDVTGIAGPSNEKATPEQRLSAFLRSETASKHSPTRSQDSSSSHQHTPSYEQPPRPSFMNSMTGSSPEGVTSSSSPGQGTTSDNSPAVGNVGRADVRASAEKILYTYLLPGSEREIILPQGILNEVTAAIEEDNRDDPEVFDQAKDYVFQAMERDAFPGFLRSKALGNVVPPSLMMRLIVGLLSLFGALWTAFCLIFLNYDRTTRCWLILPFTVAVYALMSHQYMCDPIIAIAGFSEYTFMSFARMKEPFVRKLLFKRAWMILAVIVLLDTAICCLFIFVPGRRL
ncbi:regulator of G protein signaling superfamily [Aulographum hederae CBS 113979]|uniref:Regulator of G protein signaling superfamily n=1 Tax=Aulographum hederae CBS 113979 TaxID=1176131 RepID=A0A6G1GXZ1_9PEZI|nr:regulator of G protein signaling superfamily [Aulographum hederae CBS 113979]